MRVVGYARQGLESGVPSVEDQAESLRLACEKAGLELVVVHADDVIFTRGVQHVSRCGITDLLDSNSRLPVLATDRERIEGASLQALDTSALFELTQVVGREAYFLSDAGSLRALRGLRKAKPPKPKPGTVEASVALRKHAKKMLAGRERAASEGRHQGGPAPYGYRRNKAKGLILRDEEATIVRRMFVTYLELRSMKKVVAMLVGEGLVTRRGNAWSRAAVAWILKNDTYSGLVHHGKSILVKGIHEPLIDQTTFNRVRRLVKANTKRFSADRANQPERAMTKENGRSAAARTGTCSRCGQVKWILRKKPDPLCAKCNLAVYGPRPNAKSLPNAEGDAHAGKGKPEDDLTALPSSEG